MKTIKIPVALFLAMTCFAGAAAAMSVSARADGVKRPVSPFTVLCEKEAADAFAEVRDREQQLFREGYAQEILLKGLQMGKEYIEKDLKIVTPSLTSLASNRAAVAKDLSDCRKDALSKDEANCFSASDWARFQLGVGATFDQLQFDMDKKALRLLATGQRDAGIAQSEAILERIKEGLSSAFYQRKLAQGDLQSCKKQADWLGLQSKDQAPESLFASHEKALPSEALGSGGSVTEGGGISGGALGAPSSPDAWWAALSRAS